MQHKKIILCAFVISGLQVQLLSPAPRKILRYAVKTTACIVGFLLLYVLQIYQNVPCLCLIAQKMPCRSALQRALCWMLGGAVLCLFTACTVCGFPPLNHCLGLLDTFV